MAFRDPHSTATSASRNSDAADQRFVRNLDKLYPLTESDRYCAQEAEQAATAEVDAAIAAARRK